MMPTDAGLRRLRAVLDASDERAWVLDGGLVRPLDAPDDGEPLAAWIAAEAPAGSGLKAAVLRGLADVRPFAVEAAGAGRWRFVPVQGADGSPAEWLVLAGRPDGNARAAGGTGGAGEASRAPDEASAQRASETLRQVRNTLAVVRAIIRRSASLDDGTEAFAHRLEGRIGAVARVRSALARGAAPDLETVVRDELTAARAGEAQVSIRGPHVSLPTQIAEALALALHELAVNAIEHGALSEPGGRIEVSWEVRPGAAGGWLRFAWAETGGPEREAPSRRGFGTDVIERMLPYDLGALTALTFGVHGLTCRIEVPLPQGPKPLT